MVFLNILRIVSDLGVYWSFAGTLAHMSGSPLLTALALLPAAVYVMVFLIRRDFSLHWGREADLFDGFWKAFAAFAAAVFLLGHGGSVLAAGLPTALLTLFLLVMLTRSLRHSPEVYCQRTYQIRSALALAAVLLAARLLSSQQCVAAALFAARKFYDFIISPVLAGIALAVGAVFIAGYTLLSKLIGPLRGESISVEMPGFGLEPGAADPMEPFRAENGALALEVLRAVGLLIGIILAIRLFLWMLRREPENPSRTNGVQERRTTLSGPSRRRRSSASLTYAGRVRGVYRKFLRLCRMDGVEISPADTTESIGRKISDRCSASAEEAALRELYRRARYLGQAGRSDYLQARKLYQEIERKWKGQADS